MSGVRTTKGTTRSARAEGARRATHSIGSGGEARSRPTARQSYALMSCDERADRPDVRAIEAFVGRPKVCSINGCSVVESRSPIAGDGHSLGDGRSGAQGRERARGSEKLASEHAVVREVVVVVGNGFAPERRVFGAELRHGGDALVSEALRAFEMRPWQQRLVEEDLVEVGPEVDTKMKEGRRGRDRRRDLDRRRRRFMSAAEREGGRQARRDDDSHIVTFNRVGRLVIPSGDTWRTPK